MATLERKPDELWTEYLVRRLQAEGFTDQNFEQTRDKTVDARTGKLELRLSIYTPESILYIKRGYPALEETLRRGSTYSKLRKSALKLDEEVRVVDCGEQQGDLSLKFQRQGLVTVQSSLPILRLPLTPYHSRTTAKAREAIDDLIRYLKAVGVEPQIEADRTRREYKPAPPIKWPDKFWFDEHYRRVDIGTDV